MNKKTILKFAIGPVGTGVLGLVIMPILAWGYTPKDVADYAMFQLLISMSFIILGLGTEQSYVREFNECNDKNSLFLSTNIVSFALIVLFSLLTLSGVSLSISESIFDINTPDLDVYILLAMIANFMIVKSQYTLRMSSSGGKYSLVQLSPKVIFIFAVFYLHYLDLKLSSIIYVQTIALILTLLISLFFTRDTWFNSLRCKFDKKATLSCIRYSLPLSLASLAFWGVSSLDRFMLYEMSTPTDVAIYAMAMNFCAVGIMLNMLFSTIWTPVVYKWIGDGVDRVEVLRVIRLVSAVVFVLICLTGTFSWISALILPKEYASVENIITACIFFSLMYGLSETTAIGLNVKRKPIFIFLATLISFLVNVTLNYILIPELGANGASIATAVSMVVYLVVKTEFSCFLWQSFSRFTIYLGVFFVASLAIFQAGFPDCQYFVILWFILLLLSCVNCMFVFKSNFFVLRRGRKEC